jgi:hypothetical protein
MKFLTVQATEHDSRKQMTSQLMIQLANNLHQPQDDEVINI